jgi:MFS family permease
VLALAVGAGVLIPLNSTMIALGLRGIARDLDVGRGTATTLVTAYLVAMLVCQPLAGRLGDRRGNRAVLAVAVVGFGVASVAAGLAPSFPALLAGRLLQAVFGAALIPNAQALLRATVARDRRGRTFGLVGTGIGAGAAVGPVLGGFLTQTVGWRGIFAVNVPLALLVLALLWRASAVVAGDVRPPPAADHQDATAPGSPGPPAPSRRLLASAPFRAACLTQTTSNFALYSVLLVLPSLLAAQGWTGSAIGLATSGLTAGLLVLGPVGGGVGDRWGRAVPIGGGLAVVAAGAVVLAAAPRSPGALVVGPLVMGLGLGLSGASLQAAAMDAVPQAVAGAAAGTYSASRYVGSIAGSVAIGISGATAAADARPVLVAVVGASVIATLLGPRSVTQPVDW